MPPARWLWIPGSRASPAPRNDAKSRLLMDLPDILLLVAAGVIGGIISSIAGGAALFIFPALLATGLEPATAAATAAHAQELAAAIAARGGSSASAPAPASSIQAALTDAIRTLRST